MMQATGAAAALQRPQTELGAFAAPADLHRICVDGRPLLFCSRTQRLFELNPTADLIWARLSAGEPAATAVADLEGLGIDRATAARFVAESARTWLLGGQLVPVAATAALAHTPAAVRTLSIDDVHVELAFFGDADPAACDPVFSQFYGPIPLEAPRLSVVGLCGLCFFFLGDRIWRTCEPDGFAAQVKALLTDIYANTLQGGFLAHGALVVRGEAAVFLSGDPGAGKTTLTLALCADGWAYGSDDIVRVQPDGSARGTPFAAGVKSGAWPLAGRCWPELVSRPVWLRDDGQRVRYFLPPERADAAFRPFSAVLLLDRRETAKARLEPVDAIEALKHLMAGAYANNWKLDAPTLAAVAARLEAAKCARLVYSDLDEAVGLVRTLSHG